MKISKIWMDFITKFRNLEKIARLELTISDMKLTILQQEETIKEADVDSNFENDNNNHFDEPESLEDYWNNKRPKTKWTFQARPMPWNAELYVKIDPRIFLTEDHTLYSYSGTNDEKAIKCFAKVIREITYTSEAKEFWQYAHETLTRRRGDCEDGAIYMAVLMLTSGIPYWRIRLNAGLVKLKGGDIGHAYITYLRESNDTWYVLDWCYWPNESKDFGKTWAAAGKYFTIWGSWNSKYMFGGKPV